MFTADWLKLGWLKLVRALAALGRVGSFVLVESPGKIDFLFAECFGYEGVLCGIASSTLVLRDLWCLPRVLMARSKNPMTVRFGFVIKEEGRLHKVHRALFVTPGALVYVEIYRGG